MRLVDLVGDGGRQLPHGRDAIDVRELRLRRAQAPRTASIRSVRSRVITRAASTRWACGRRGE